MVSRNTNAKRRLVAKSPSEASKKMYNNANNEHLCTFSNPHQMKVRIRAILGNQNMWKECDIETSCEWRAAYFCITITIKRMAYMKQLRNSAGVPLQLWDPTSMRVTSSIVENYRCNRSENDVRRNIQTRMRVMSTSFLSHDHTATTRHGYSFQWRQTWLTP